MLLKGKLTKLTEVVRQGFIDAKHTDIWSKAGEFTFAEKGNVVLLRASMKIAENKVKKMQEKDESVFIKYWVNVLRECADRLAEIIDMGLVNFSGSIHLENVQISFVGEGSSLKRQVTDWKSKSDEAAKDLQNLAPDTDESVRDEAVNSASQLKSLGDIIQEHLTSILSASKAQLADAAKVYNSANPPQRRIRSLWSNLSRKGQSTSQSAQPNTSDGGTDGTELASAWLSTFGAREMGALTLLGTALSQVASSMHQSNVGSLPEASDASVSQPTSAAHSAFPI